MSLLLWIGVLAASLYALIRASDYFTDSAEKIGRFLGLSTFVIGATIIAVGTSLPEVMSSVLSVLKESSEIVIGNVIGSNIANILLILGITAILSRRLRFTYRFINADMPILVVSIFLLATTILDGLLTLTEALLFVGGIAVYFGYSIKAARKKHQIAVIRKQAIGIEEEKPKRPTTKAILVLIGSALFIYLGANYTIEAVIEISSMLDIGKEVIAASAIALGTSLPELAVTLTAVRKRKPEVAIGNIFGSNIFNTFVVTGIPALFGVLVIPQSMLTFGLPVMMLATMIFWVFSRRGRLGPLEGFLMLGLYAAFILSMFGLNTYIL